MSFPSGTDMGAMVLATAGAANSLAAVQRKGNRKAEFIVVCQVCNMHAASYTNIIATDISLDVKWGNRWTTSAATPTTYAAFQQPFLSRKKKST